jgi:predicted dehydrogenase
MTAKRYRAGAIGHTGKGNFGHRLHMPYCNLDNVDFIAVADPDKEGRQKAVVETGADHGYASYHDMLAKESLDIVSVCPRWVDQHEEMILACLSAGCHIYCEKPMAADLASADRIVAAAGSAGLKIAVAHQGVYLPQVQAVREWVSSGRIGKLLALEAYGKQDHRGGGEDTLVLGTHLFNMMRLFAGNPKTVMARVGKEGADVVLTDAQEANEPIGLIAGDFVTSTFLFDADVTGHFTSRRDQPGKGRGYGLVLIGETARIAINGDAGFVSMLESDVWTPWESGQTWRDLGVPMGSLQSDGNRLAVMDLIAAVEENRDPISSADDARWALEMIHGIYASHLSSTRVSFPLDIRTHPLAH